MLTIIAVMLIGTPINMPVKAYSVTPYTFVKYVFGGGVGDKYVNARFEMQWISDTQLKVTLKGDAINTANSWLNTYNRIRITSGATTYVSDTDVSSASLSSIVTFTLNTAVPYNTVSFNVYLGYSTWDSVNGGYVTNWDYSVYMGGLRFGQKPDFIVYAKRGASIPYNPIVVTNTLYSDPDTILCVKGPSDYWNYIYPSDGSAYGNIMSSMSSYRINETQFFAVKFYDVPTSVGDLKLQ